MWEHEFEIENNYLKVNVVQGQGLVYNQNDIYTDKISCNVF